MSRKYLIDQPFMWETQLNLGGTIDNVRNAFDSMTLELLNGRISFIVQALKKAGKTVESLGLDVCGKRIIDIKADRKKGILLVVFNKEDHPEELSENLDAAEQAEILCYELEKRLVSPKARLCKENPRLPLLKLKAKNDITKAAIEALRFITKEADKSPGNAITSIIVSAASLISFFDRGDGKLFSLFEEMVDKGNALSQETTPSILIPLNKKAS